MFSFVKLNKPVEPVKLNLICLHWAGGTAIGFKPLAKFLEASNVCVYGISLPGRNGRGTNTMFRSFVDLVNALLPEFTKFHAENKFGELPLVLFGHSFGGLLAYELTKAISKNQDYGIIIDKVVVSAVRSPQELTEQNKDSGRICHHKQSNRDLTEYMRGIGGIPPGVDPSIIEMMLPTIKGDYEAFETYDMAAFGAQKLGSPVTMFVAEQDASVSAQDMAGWEDTTSEEFTSVTIEHGTHFYITDAATKDVFYDRLLEELQKHFPSGGSFCTVN